jgi:cobalt/nickel transport system permease protein
MFVSVSLPLAVHIADGVLSWPVLAVGFALAALLVGVAAWRIREDEIPRIALLTAAFFVASSIHIKLGPAASAHLLLNGLVGVILGRRAPLAILIGVALQALLVAHGGISVIGVTTCIETVPALLVGALFGLVSFGSGEERWQRSALVAVTALLWGGCLAVGLAVLWTNPLPDLVRWTSGGGLVVSVEHLEPAFAILRHPLTLAGLGLFVVAAVVLERWLGCSPAFVRGMLVGVSSVLMTVLLKGLVLVLDGAEVWGTLVSVEFVAHLPLALLEGLIVGTIVAFLTRVKPEMLGITRAKVVETTAKPPAPPHTRQAVHTSSVRALLAVLAVLALGGPALAHGVVVDYQVEIAAKQVTVRSAFDTDEPDKRDVPKNAPVRVLREDGSVLARGKTDDEGVFVFSYEQPEPLRVHIDVPGHPTVCRISAAELQEQAAPEPAVRSSRLRDLLLGLGLLLAVASFVMSWRNSVRLRRLAETIERRA